MKKVSVIGHFAFGLKYLDGQTVKTKILADELCKKFGDQEVIKFDTHGGVKTLIKSPVHTIKALKKSKNVIILPAHNGLRVFGKILPCFKVFFKNRKIHYVVIGGWLPKFLSNKKGLARSLKSFDGIYVETNTMKNELLKQGFNNVYVLPNCKDLEILSSDELVYNSKTPFKLCTFSRVMKEKGIEDAINAIKSINEESGKEIYSLDIFGQVDPAQTEWFENLRNTFPKYIRYGGAVPFDKSVEVLKDYFALLFPTRFYTEGIPGTIIDAYAAGIPVISAKWESCLDIVDEGQTGFVYEFENLEQFKQILFDISKEPMLALNMKENCIKKATDYIPETAIKVLTDKFI